MKLATKNLVDALKQALGNQKLFTDAIDLRLYDTDATSLFKNQAALVTIPETTEDVIKIVKTINQVNHDLKLDEDQRFNFVVRGAGTGLSGGAIGNQRSVIISIAKLDRLLHYDAVDAIALVEPGLVNANLSKLVKETALHFSPDPSSQESCTLGGNIAENAGGIHCYKHGVTSQQILGLELVTPDGDLVYLGQLNEKDFAIKSSKIDFAKFMAGSEGTLGVVTKALVKLQPIPESFLTMQISFLHVEDAARTVSTVIKNGFKPTALELIDHGAIEAVNSAYNLGFSPEIKAILLLELDGVNEEVLLEAKQIRLMLENPINNLRPQQIRKTQDLKERSFLWKVRKGTVAAFGQIAPFWYLYDAVVPRSKIPEAMVAIEAIAQKYQLKLASVCHAADGNLHPNFLYDPDKDPTVIERIHQASKEVLQLCINLGGVLSGEHGIGLEKRDYMPLMFSDTDLCTMISVRKIFDPNSISNPDKIFPLRICKEF